MPDRDPFPQRLRQLREALGWSRYFLAQQSGVPQSTLADLEHGKKSPTLSTLRKLCRALGCSLAEFDEGSQ